MADWADDESELTEFSEEDEVPLSSQKSKRRSKKEEDDEGGYRIKGALKVPRVANYTTQSLHDQVVAGDIDLDPEYQRAVVWPETKQTGLIDSLFRNFYVPPVIFVVETRDDGSEHRTCVDGKQRLTSINRFLQGQIPYKDPQTNEKFFFQVRPDTKGKLLPERYRKLFKNKQIVCIEYENLRPESEREIFQRVQLGMALTTAEKMQASKSPRATFVRELVNSFITERLGVCLELDIMRGADFKHVANTMMALDNWEDKHDIPTDAARWVQKDVEIDGALKSDAREVFEIFSRMAEDEKLKRSFEIRDEKKVKKVAPIEFVAICCLIFQFKDKLTLAQLSEAVKLMRQEIRGREKDVRFNTRTAKPLADFITKLKPKKLKADPGKPVASKIVSPSSKSKRKREQSEEDELESDEEEEVAQTLTKRTRKSAAAKSTPARTSASKGKASSSSEPQTPIVPLPRGPTATQSLPNVSNNPPPATDPRRRASDIIPKAEPSPTPVPPAPAAPPLYAQHSPPPPLGANYPNPYPTPTPHGQTPSPNPNLWTPTQNNMFTDRLAALRAAKEQSAAVNPFWPPPTQPNGFPYGTPPASQPQNSQSMSQMSPAAGMGSLAALSEQLLTRMSQSFAGATFPPQAQQQPAPNGMGGPPPGGAQ